MHEREKQREEIIEACDDAECSDKIRKIHFEQFLNRRWNPHPPAEFIAWWSTHLDGKIHGVKTSVAWNTRHYRDQYMEARSVGAA